MARGSKFSSDELQQIVNSFFKERKHLITKVTFGKLAEYAIEKLNYHGIEYYHFSRNKEISSMIKEFNKKIEVGYRQGYVENNSPFSGIKINDFIRNVEGNSEKLKFFLTLLQEWDKKQHTKILENEQQINELNEKLSVVIEKNEKFKVKCKALKEEYKNTVADIKILKEALGEKHLKQLTNALNSTGLVKYPQDDESVQKDDIKGIKNNNGKDILKLLEEYNEIF